MNGRVEAASQLRLAELLAALSLVTDLGVGQPPGEAMRSCVLATALARRMGFDEATVRDVYYTTLLKYLGCTAYASEEAAFFGGDDIALRSLGARVDFGDPREALAFILFQPGRGQPLPKRLRIVARALGQGGEFDRQLDASHCEVAAMLARRLGLPEGVRKGLHQVMERWDGKGGPRRLAGDEAVPAARLALLASRAVVFARLGGADLASTMLRRWERKLFDPELVAAFVRHGPALLDELATLDVVRAVVDAEPEPRLWIAESRIDDIAHAFADMADLKVPYLRGHAPGVAALAAGAAGGLGLAESEVVSLRRAALMHDLGRVGVANGVWERPGPLPMSEWEQVRLHPYHSERILSCSSVLEPLAAIAGMHHERLDGSGYHRRAKVAALPLQARILAAADCYEAMIHERPYRPARTADEAAGELLDEVRRGRLDGDAVQAVLGAAGHHVQHIYDKIGVSTRAGAAMFAMENGLA